VVVIVALAIVIDLLWREVGPLRAEVRRLQMEFDHLSIDDPNEATAIQASPVSQGFSAMVNLRAG
jgi:hypothetical protein